MKIVFCQATFAEDFDKTLECIFRVKQLVDEVIVTVDQTITEEMEETLTNLGVHKVHHLFEDDMPAMRNSYLERAKELGADWVCVSDPDELYSEELVENLRRLITEYESLGYTLLAVPGRDQFENEEWLDDLDMLKESPGGYRETDFWKPMLIFKLSQDVHYEGVGKQGRVHEQIVSAKGWNSIKIPKQYYYVHKKSAFRIWRNAARNMFIGGGGDNIGDLNPLWSELRRICSFVGIDTWKDFESAVEHHYESLDESIGFSVWLDKALQAPPTNWGTETRELAKWYYIQNKHKLSGDVQRLIDNPPKMTPEIEATNYVRRAYFEVLGRHPDEKGLTTYTELLLSGKISKETLVKELMNSKEYKQKSGLFEEIEQVPVKVPVNVSVNITEGIFVEAMMRSDTYWCRVKPKLDIGNKFLGNLRGGKVNEFLNKLYDPIEKSEPIDLAVWLMNNLAKPNSVALCIMGFHDGLDLIVESLKVASDFVDEIHIQGDDFTELDHDAILTAISRFTDKQIRVEIHQVPWMDDFSDYKNKAIAQASTEWVLILDHDEIPTEDMMVNLSKILQGSDRGKKYNIVRFSVSDERTENGEVVAQTRSLEGKGLLHWNIPNPYYGNPHIWLRPNYYDWRYAVSGSMYRHVKEVGSELSRSVRNVFLGGGGDNSRESNPLWVKLREVCDGLGIKTWNQFHEYLKGEISSDLLLVLEELAEHPWKDDELKDPLKYYDILHPKEEE